VKIYQNFINGGFVATANGRRMPTSNPFSGEVWAEVADDPAAVDVAVRAARAAFEDGPWATMAGRERAHLMMELGRILTRDAVELGVVESRDNGKIIRETSAQAKSLQGYLDYFAGMADKIVGQQIPAPSSNFLVYTERVPVGVIGAIIPWNSPLALLTWKLGPLLAAGCTAVVKPSDITPVTALLLAERATEAGFPPGVINVVTGGAEVGAAITSHSGIDKLTFTGGGATARHVARAAAENLTPTVLELGGKSPQIISMTQIRQRPPTDCWRGSSPRVGRHVLPGPVPTSMPTSPTKSSSGWLTAPNLWCSEIQLMWPQRWAQLRPMLSAIEFSQ
jgi:acyl-CoA reductase-like NAD-dependent aldehyde dehydrogenase